MTVSLFSKMNSLVSFATEFKLNPRIGYELNISELWHNNLRCHLAAICIVYEYYYKKEIKNIYDVVN